MAAIVAACALVITGVTFFNPVDAQAYDAAPETIKVGDTVTVSPTRYDYLYRYDFTVDKAGQFTLSGSAKGISPAVYDHQTSNSTYFAIYRENDDSRIWDASSADGEVVYFQFNKFILSEGSYYIEVKTRDTWIGYATNIEFTLSERPLANAKIKNLKKGVNRSIEISLAKNTLCSGYDIEAAKNKAFTKGVKHFSTANSDYALTSFTTGSLKKKTKYYVRVRAYYNSVDGNLIYSDWSNVKSKVTGSKMAPTNW